MRIAHVSDCFLPRLGGIEAQVDGLARVQTAGGNEVVVATTTPGGGLDCGDGQGPRLRRLSGTVPTGLTLTPGTSARLDRTLRAERPDVVHAHVSVVSPLAWRAVGWAVRHGVPAVVTMHSMWGPVARRVYRGLDAVTGWVRSPLLVTAVSEAAAAAVAATDERLVVRVVSNGIDVARWAAAAGTPAAAARMPAAGVVHVLAVGRFAPRKRPVGLLKVLRAAARRLGPDAALRATVVGAGSALPAMRCYLRRHRMTGTVALPGRLAASAIRRLLAEADIFLAPATLESFGLAALEARTAGVPIVARRGTGITDFVADGREGLLAATDAGLVDAVVTLGSDPGLRAAIADHNRATPPLDRDWSAVAGEFLACYADAQLLAARRR